MTSKTATSVPVDSAVDSDLYCIGCDYNLRTLAWGAICPECGTAVQESLWNDADLRWLSKIRRGMTILLAASIVSTFVAICWSLFVIASPTTLFLFGVVTFLNQIVPFFSVAAAFMIARKPPGLRYSRFETLRSLVRLTSMAALAAALVQNIGAGLLRPDQSGFLLYAVLISIFWVWQCLVAYYVYLVLEGLGVRLCGRLTLALALLTLVWVLGEANVFTFYRFGPWKLTSSPAWYFAYFAVYAGSGLACTIFYYRCRRGATQFLKDRSAAGAGPSLPTAVSVQSGQ